jgi:type I restriction enzyme S subunit
MSVVRNGYGLKPDDSGEYRILRIGAVRSMKIDLTDYRLNKTEFSYEDIIHENDLLFTRYNGSREYVGVCACVPRLDVEYAFPDKIIKCTPKLDNTYHSKYLQFYVSQGKARDYIRSKIKTTSGQNGIAGSDIKRILVNLPSIDKQQKIVEKIESRLSVCDSIEQSIDSSLQQAAAMRQSILKQAFEGRL